MKQQKGLENHNRKRQPLKTYAVGEVVYVRQNKRLGSKLTPRYRAEMVKENMLLWYSKRG